MVVSYERPQGGLQSTRITVSIRVFPKGFAVTSVFSRFVVVISLATLATFPPLASAGDWPQILGPNRDGVAVGEKIVDKLPAGGPKTVWQKSIGEGYAGVAVSSGRAILFHRVGNKEVVESYDALTGAPQWKHAFAANYGGGVNSDTGPRCVPLIHDGAVYLFGAAGDLHSVSLANGEPRWSRAAYKEYNGSEGYFGAGSTPIVAGDKLLLNVGGRGAGIVAFHLKDGTTAWKATDEGASYSSPTAVTIDGVQHTIFVTRLSALSIDAANGKVRWQFPFGARGPTVNAATPLVIDGHLFLSASYGVGAVWAKIGKTGATKVWDSNDIMSSQYTTCVYHDGSLFGIHGRSDIPPANLVCFDPKTGKERWSKTNFGMANLILADGKLILVDEQGTLVLATASRKGYEALGRAQILNSTTRALPALANGLLYVRDAETLKCVDLRPNK
jgi:outer membrane protein assembly factor BamB